MIIHNLHRWNITPKKAIQIQRKLSTKIRYTPLRKRTKIISGCDASFQGKKAIGSIVIMTYPELQVIEQVRKEIPVTYPYIPTLLTFREAPVLIKCFRMLKHDPDVIIFDGQGIAHPRRMGLATHMGILLSKPTIGCAKSRLTGTIKMPLSLRGNFTYIKDNKRNIIGALLRTRDEVKPVFISVGNKITLEECIKIILGCDGKYRLPEPIRAAHNLASPRRSQKTEF